MAKNRAGDLVDWDPELSPEGVEFAAQLEAEFESRVSLVKSIRTAVGLSQAEVARILEVSQSNVSKIEGRGDPTLSVLARMIEAKGGKLRLEVETAAGDELRFAIVG